MRPSLCLVLAGSSLACAAMVIGAQGGGTAAALRFLEEPFGNPEVVAEGTAPARFTVSLEREMPTPGWGCQVDAVETDAATGRIVVEVSEIEPTGIVTQVITKTRCRIALGTLAPGRYVLEIRGRRGTTARHEPIQAFVLDARP
jgi:hypothetical protein